MGLRCIVAYVLDGTYVRNRFRAPVMAIKVVSII